MAKKDAKSFNDREKVNRDSAANMGKYARCATIYHTIASIVIQTGVNKNV